MREIVIIKLEDLKELDEFITATNKNVQNAKQEIKNKVLDFLTSADELIKNSQANDAYKQTFNITQMASDAISGKPKDLMSAMKIELTNLSLRLDNNARETSEKLAIINKYDDDIVQDKEFLLQLLSGVLIDTLDDRKHNQEQRIKYEAQKLADEIEAERLNAIKIETEKLEAEIELEKIKAEKIDATDDYIEYINVPINFVEAVAHVGYDNSFESVNYQLSAKWARMAHEILRKK